MASAVFNTFIQSRKVEWDQYRAQITDYELKRYLPERNNSNWISYLQSLC